MGASAIWVDGSLVDPKTATVNLVSHTLQYGSGVLEGIRAYRTPRGTAVFRLVEHLTRLHQSAKLMLFAVPFGIDELTEAVCETVRASGLDECYIRPVAYLGGGEMALHAAAPVSVAIAAWPWGPFLGPASAEKGISCVTSSWRRVDSSAIPVAAKATGIYANTVLAKREAIAAGFDEALFLSPAGYVAECSSENIFVVMDGELWTPPISVGILGGITRQTVIELAGDLGITVREENFLRSAIFSADEVFITGTAAEIVPVVRLDHRAIGDGEPGHMTRKLQDVFRAATRGELAQYAEWLTPVL